ncbi:MAG: diaminopimelate epimerase [Ignavibacteriae bacterium]|nr:MAG: diaminopimelate epimerase [Ignavibacteriota bacterium]
MEMNHFVKSHGLGNEYVVLDSESVGFPLNESNIKKICNVHFGIGSDGILLKVPSRNADFGLNIFNPDGSEAEKSGNGLRIFSKYLFDYKWSKGNNFTVETKGGIVRASVIESIKDRARVIKIDMGKALFESTVIPVNCSKPECIDEPLSVGDAQFAINCVSVGNPHCVILREKLDSDEIKKYGPQIENNKMFPHRINVQFAKVLNDSEVEILIWERGAGFTLASGSSSCAVASVLYKKGLIQSTAAVHMLGGTLKISIDKLWNLQMTGEVKQIAEGVLSADLLEELG